MSDSMQTPAGVVVDYPMGKALLYAATLEGLLDDDPTIGDGFVRTLMSHPPSEKLLADSLEQLVLGGKVFVSFPVPFDWKGELFERQIIEPVEPATEKELIQVSQMPPDIVLGMLAARGIVWSEAELEQRYQAFLDAYSAWEAVAEGKSFDGLEIRMMLSSIIPLDEEYSPEQLARWKAVQHEHGLLYHVLDCIDVYQKVLTGAMNLSALSSLPIHASSIASLEMPEVTDSVDKSTLLKVTCKQLRRVPIGATLRETIQLATSSEAEALRIKLGDWADKLREGKFDPGVIALREVEKARTNLMGAKRLSRVGEYLTWLSVPSGVATTFVTGPIGVGVGLGMAAVGTLALVGQKQIEKSNLWAMYGQI